MKSLLFIALLLGPLFVGAQSFTVRGVVRAKADGQVLAGATIVEKGTANGTSTDAQGRFTLVTIRSAPQVVVSLIGYATRELAITKNENALVVVLQADEKSLAEVVVVGRAAAPRRSSSGATSTLAGKAAGVRIRSASRALAPSSTALPDATAVSGAADAPAAPSAAAVKVSSGGVRAGAGVLTAGEINDFGKWTLWPDIAQQDLREWRQRWQISPLERYSAQLVTDDGFPVVGASVCLKDGRDSLLWQAQSDNTGKCELWNGLFTGAASKKVASLQAVVGGKTYVVSHPTAFHEGINSIRVQQPCRAPAALDIAFVVDATGSMGDEIQYLQTELQDVIARAKDSLATSTFNLGSVFYRDAGDEYVTRKTNLSANLPSALEFIRRQQANGGGDFPEAVDRALAVAVDSLAWADQAKARLLFLILDAPPHENPQVLASLQQSIRKAAAKGIRIIPITASGIDKSTEYLMRALALATNGTYVFLTDDSGVGDAHLKPTTDKFDVEKLNTLLVKLITKYAHSTNCQSPKGGLTSNAGALSGRYQQAAATAPPTRRRGKVYTWKCYPNPAADILHVELEEEVAELFVTDVTGKIVLRAVPTRNQAAIQLGSFPTGVYFLKFFTDSSWEQAKFLVSR